MISLIRPTWFAKDVEHSLVDLHGDPLVHGFYDLRPAFSKNKKFVNALILSSMGSTVLNQLDLQSGQKYFYKKYCPEFKLPFSIGYIPRTLDQLGMPQKIIIFGNEERISKTLENSFLRIKMVGAFTEKFCLELECEEKSNWLTRLVFIGIDFQDKEFSQIDSLENFLQKYKWDKIKTSILNISKLNLEKDTTSSSFDVSSPIELEQAFDFFKKNSIHFSEAELKKIKSNCHALYDKFWIDAGEFREEDKSVSTVKELSQKLKKIKELERQGFLIGFDKRLQKFTESHYESLLTCSKFVYAGNLQKNPEKFWFFKYLNFFFRLHDEGYFFDCNYNSWQRNVINFRGERIYNLKEGIKNCSKESLDKAMMYLTLNLLKSIRESGKDYYRFIDYDNHQKGTHKKIYSWVKMAAGETSCKNEKTNKDPVIKSSQEISLFPDDIKWKPRSSRDSFTKEKIFY